MTGMYQCRDIVFPGQYILETRGPRKFVLGHIDPGRPVNPLERLHKPSVLTNEVYGPRTSRNEIQGEKRISKAKDR